METHALRLTKVYDRYIGQHIIVYYRDLRGTDRKLHGVLESTDGGCLHLRNNEWRGSLNYRKADITLVSTVAGWNKNQGDQDEERPGFFRRLLKR